MDAQEKCCHRSLVMHKDQRKAVIEDWVYRRALSHYIDVLLQLTEHFLEPLHGVLRFRQPVVRYASDLVGQGEICQGGDTWCGRDHSFIRW
jgi:hypothetical protein